MPLADAQRFDAQREVRYPEGGNRGGRPGAHAVQGEHCVNDSPHQDARVGYQSLLSLEQMEKARIAKETRKLTTDARNGRKGAILESLGNFEIGDDFAQSFSEPPPVPNLLVQPSLITKDREPFRQNGAPSTEVDGVIVPSDQAYTDMVLDNGSTLPAGTVWADYVQVESFSDKFCDDLNAVRYVNTHTIKYNGEALWKLVTEHSCNASGNRGQSSSCILMKAKGILRVKISHKGRNNKGSGWNSRETREYQVADIIKASGEARGRDLFAQ
jgi:hypothetical protein